MQKLAFCWHHLSSRNCFIGTLKNVKYWVTPIFCFEKNNNDGEWGGSLRLKTMSSPVCPLNRLSSLPIVATLWERSYFFQISTVGSLVQNHWRNILKTLTISVKTCARTSKFDLQKGWMITVGSKEMQEAPSLLLHCYNPDLITLMDARTLCPLRAIVF